MFSSHILFSTLATSVLILGEKAVSLEPVSDWSFQPGLYVEGEGLRDQISGAVATAQGEPSFGLVEGYPFLDFDGGLTFLTIPESTLTPQREMTVSAWVRIRRTTEWGGILSAFQDNGDAEKGWVLGYDNDSFTFGLGTDGADDGNGMMTYLDSNFEIDSRRWYHVAATYDGLTMRIYVNGEEQNNSTSQSGDVLYPDEFEYVIASYKDVNEDFRLDGMLHQVTVWDSALDAQAIGSLYESKQALAEWSANQDPDLQFVVAPYLQFPFPTTMTVRWETTKASESIVHWGLSLPFENETVGSSGPFNAVTLEGLEPGTNYHYQVQSTTAAGGDIISDVYHFRTPPAEEIPFNFVVICDTQSNPAVVNAIATLASRHRPAFTLLGGDLVTTGSNKSHWTEHFFPNMEPVNTSVPLLPVLGNHEQDAQLYYDYFSLPAPEYYWRWTYSNLEVFGIDSDRPTEPGSEQYDWLDGALSDSDAEWKIVILHKPAWSSDENDYGDTYNSTSNYGDVRMRTLIPLYEEHGVDIVWSGHIHSYERTYPILGGNPVAASEGGVLYMITGGGGGGLEKAAPTKPLFSANTMSGHHYTFVEIAGGVLNATVYDLAGNVFDRFTVEK